MVAAPNAALARIHTQIMWNRLIAVVEEQAQTMLRTAFSTSVREAGDLSAGVFDRHGRMLAQAVTGTPGHVNSMANAVTHFLDVFPLDSHEAGRPLHHQRSLADLRPSARHHGGDAELLSRPSRRPVRQHHPRGGHRRPRHGAGRTAGVRGRPGDPDHAARARRRHERGPAAHRARQCARAAAGRRRHLRLRRLQRRGQPAPCRDDGRVRDRQSRPARRHHRGSLARGDARAHPRVAQRHLPQQPDHGRLRQAAHAQRRADHLGRRHARRFRRHLAGVGLRHQRRLQLLPRLHRLRRQMPGRARGAEQCRLAGADHGERAGRLRAQRQAAVAGGGAPYGRADAARRRVRLSASA